MMPNTDLRRSLDDILQERCHRILKEIPIENWDALPSEIIRREIALTLDHMHRAQRMNRDMKYRLLKIETYVNTHLLRMEYNFVSKYATHKHILHKQLHEIEIERFRLREKQEERMNGLRDRLLDLLNKHTQIDFK